MYSVGDHRTFEQQPWIEKGLHIDVRCLGSEQLFTSLSRKRCIIERQDNIADVDLPFLLVLLEPRWKIVLFDMSWPVPWGEESILPEVSMAG